MAISSEVGRFGLLAGRLRPIAPSEVVRYRLRPPSSVLGRVLMWMVDNRTPFVAERSWIRDRNGAEVWLVAIKGTFDVRPDGSTVLASEQVPVTLVPEYADDPATSSLLYDTDFVLTKPTTDVVLHGSAHAPGGRPTPIVDVTMQVGDIRKTLRVTGNRRYQHGFSGVSPGPAAPFVRLPLGYERAYGGRDPTSTGPDHPIFDERNPIGVGFAPALGHPAPNVEYPSALGRSRPAGFGPIPPHWKPRSSRAGTYDDAWLEHRYPLYPDDLEEDFFLCSPEDQRPARFLRGGEPVVLTNLDPSGHLAFVIPRVALGFETIFRDGERVTHGATMHTLVLEPDVPRVIVVWRTSLACHPKVQQLVRTMVWEKEVVALRGSECQ